jgi:hypothetical protein
MTLSYRKRDSVAPFYVSLLTLIVPRPSKIRYIFI